MCCLEEISCDMSNSDKYTPPTQRMIYSVLRIGGFTQILNIAKANELKNKRDMNIPVEIKKEPVEVPENFKNKYNNLISS